jgi:putative spermidine/putrescine transport system permease protein
MFLRWVTATYLVYLAVPIALLAVGSAGELWLNTLLPTGFTTQWYRDVASDPSFRRAFASSLAVVAITCTACAAIGLPLAYAVFRAESARVRALARVLYQLPVALPPLVLAFGFILVFSSDTLPWLGSIWLLAAGHVVLALPYFLQTVVADMQRLGLRTLEDAAESLGSRGPQRFAHIVLPALRQSILAGLIIVAALSIGEFQFSNLVAGFLNRTYPVVLLQAFYGATGFACAATVVLLALALVAAVAGSLTAGGATRFRTAVA